VEMKVNFILKLEQVTTLLRKDLNWKFKESKDASTKTNIIKIAGSLEVSKFRSKVPFEIKNWTTLVINHYAMNYSFVLLSETARPTIMLLAPWESAQ